MGRRHGGRGRRDHPGEQAVRPPAEPPRCRHARNPDHDHRQPRGEIRRLVLPRLEGREEVHRERRVVEPVRVEASSVRHRPRTRNDVLLVRVQERKGKPVPDAASSFRTTKLVSQEKADTSRVCRLGRQIDPKMLQS